MPSPQIVDLPQQTREASIQPGTWRDADNAVQIVWTTGARRRAYDWMTDQLYDEELAVDAESVDMSRFQAGTVQVLDGHRAYGGVDAILGIADRGWIADGMGTADVRLRTSTPELAAVAADVKAGLIRAVSFGYSVQRYEMRRPQDRTDGGTVPLYRATRWTPQEISFVAVPADPNAGTRAAVESGSTAAATASAASDAAAPATATRTAPSELIVRTAATAPHTPAAAPAVHPTATARQGAGTVQTHSEPAQENHTMPNQVANQAAQPNPQDDATRAAAAAPVTPAPAAADDAIQRAADISDLCTRHGVPQLAAGYIRAGLTPEAAGLKILAELAVRDAAAGGHTNVRSIRTVADETEVTRAGIEEALGNRLDAGVKLTDNGRQFRGMSLLEIGRSYLQQRGIDTRGMDRMRVAAEMLHFRSGAGMHSTSDFANLLSNVANKRLAGAYNENPGTFKMWARRAPNAPDFKAINIVQLSAAPELLRTNEHGEFKYGTMKDGAESYSVVTYGSIVSLTRQAIVNDDLRGFDRMVAAFGASAARLENRTVYAILTANATMGDGVALFSGVSGNRLQANIQSGGGSALSITSLIEGRRLMRLMKGLNSEELNLTPSYLIVPAALEQTSYQLTSPNYTPATQGNISEFRAGGRTALEPVVEPLLDADSGTKWYMAASNTAVDTVEYAYLDGAEGPVIDSEVGFEVDGISYRCRLDFGAKAGDHRGLHRSAGA